MAGEVADTFRASLKFMDASSFARPLCIQRSIYFPVYLPFSRLRQPEVWPTRQLLFDLQTSELYFVLRSGFLQILAKLKEDGFKDRSPKECYISELCSRRGEGRKWFKKKEDWGQNGSNKVERRKLRCRFKRRACVNAGFFSLNVGWWV